MNNVVCLISSYREGKLIRGTVYSALIAAYDVIVFDGKTKPGAEIRGEETNLGYHEHSARVKVVREDWPNEHTKRTAMLNMAREIHPLKDFWILTLDADEILVWGEYLMDWLNVLQPGYPEPGENVVPIKRTEAAWTDTGFLSDVAPSRLIHSSMVKEYLVSCWRILTPDDKVFEAGHYRAPRQPMYGEPHIHHRPYLRRIERAAYREHKSEEWEHTRAMRELMEHLPDTAGEIDSIREAKDE